jgi:CopA family copper-resistance protein
MFRSRAVARPHDLGRRRFVQGLAVGGAMAGLGFPRTSLWAVDRATPGGVLTGTHFELAIGETTVNFTGRPARALAVNGSIPAPLLRWREGDTVTLRVSNRTAKEDASIHWHGIVLPANMDGVPGLSFGGIRPGEAYLYRFNVRQSGTYWYHSHSAFQEQKGVYGPLVIEPRDPSPVRADRDYVVMLTDWTDEEGEQIFSKLKKQADYYNFNQRTLGDFLADARRKGWERAVEDRAMWAQMRMRPTDLADVSGSTYTYLMNGSTPAGNWTGLFRSGERVRLRFINGSAMTYFDVRIPGLKMTVVASDGQYVHPVSVDEFRIAVAETMDVIVEPSGQDAFTIFAQSMDRTGFARGTLAVREGLTPPVPPLDPRPLLTMSDMGMAGHGAHGSMPVSPSQSSAAGSHAAHGTASSAEAQAAHEAHSGHESGAGPASSDAHGGHETSASPGDGMQMHPRTEQGNPLVDNQAMTPSTRLDEPGVGLRNNGRRVLTYGDLRSVFADPDGRDPGRSIELHLTGHMELFAWSFNGVKFSSAEPLALNYGERLQIVLVNDTMMAHPIHLHGMWSDLEDERGEFLVRKHTLDMPPGTKRSYRVTADALGRWAYHCHLLYHMEAGMFREVCVNPT